MKPFLAILGIAAVVLPQSQAPSTPKSGTGRMVLVDVVVRSKNGAVTGLSKTDFVLADKGKEQKIEVFSATAARGNTANGTPRTPGIGVNRVDWRGTQVQSTSIILFDRLNMTNTDQAAVRGQVLAFLSSLKETDSVAFYSLGEGLTIVHDFTENPAILARAAARLRDSANPSQPDDPAERSTVKALQESLVPDQTRTPAFRVATTMRAFQSISRHLAGLPGRKNLVWIASTYPTTFGSDVNRRIEYDREVNAGIAILQEENVALYTINPGGAGAGATETFTDNSRRPQEGHLMPGANAAQSSQGAISDLSTLHTITDATGGVTYENANEIASAMTSALADQELEYTLGYYPDEKTLDGKLHDLNVKLVKKNETAGASVRYRKKYLATKTDPRSLTPPVGELATDPLNATAVTVAALAQPDAARPGFKKVDVLVNVNDVKLELRGDHWIGAFELGLYIDGGGTASGSAQTINIDFTKEQLTQALTSGLIVGSAIDTKNQPVKLRAVVRDRASGAAGSVSVPAG